MARLKNQVTALTNALQKSHQNSPSNSQDNTELEGIIKRLVQHFSKHLQVVKDEIVDPYSSARPVTVIKHKKIEEIFRAST